MSEENAIAKADEAVAADQGSVDSAAKMRRLTLIFLLVSVLFFVWYLFADRLTPSTSQARVRGYIVPISSEVPGRVEKIHVISDQIVKQGALLIEIEKEPYEVAVREAEVALQDAVQQVGGDEKGIVAAEATLDEAKVRYQTALKDARRAAAIADTGAIAARDVDIAYAKAEEAKASIAKAQAGVEEARNRFGQEGEENTRYRKAMAQLEQARLNLQYTEIYAPYDGVVSNMKLEVGQYASPGAKLFSFISTKDVWVEAYLRENNLGNLAPGNPVDIVLDSAPGRVFSGRIESVSYGVKWNKNEVPGDLAVVSTNSGWLRDPQRFPVVIKFGDDRPRGLLREGGQADVMIYTGDSFIMNSLGWTWARLISLLSYIY
jgi:multidrug resistance efflux pump